LYNLIVNIVLYVVLRKNINY